MKVALNAIKQVYIIFYLHSYVVAARVECTLNLTRWHTTTSFIFITTTTLVLKIYFTIVRHANGIPFVRIWHHKRRGNHDGHNNTNKGFHLFFLFSFLSSETISISIKQTSIPPHVGVCLKLWSIFQCNTSVYHTVFCVQWVKMRGGSSTKRISSSLVSSHLM